MHITSPHNPTFKKLESLLKSKGLKKEQACLVSGESLTKELLKSHEAQATRLHFDPNTNPDILLDKSLYKRLNPLPTEGLLLKLPLPKIDPFDFSKSPQGLEVILPAGDPKNLGALIRTSLAFGASKVILLADAAHPFLPTSIKASSGAVFHMPIFKGPSLSKLSYDPSIWTLDKRGQHLPSFNPKLFSLRLLVGEEGGHLPKSLLKQSLSIPISAAVESLNVNSALSVVLYHLRCQMD